MIARPEWNEPDSPREPRYPPKERDYIPLIAWVISIPISLLMWWGIIALFEAPVSHMLSLAR